MRSMNCDICRVRPATMDGTCRDIHCPSGGRRTDYELVDVSVTFHTRLFLPFGAIPTRLDINREVLRQKLNTGDYGVAATKRTPCDQYGRPLGR